MSEQYIELYKKYRPRVWDDIIGQETVVNSLKNAIINNTIPTAYLFNGLAGSGKTTSAFILAKALNCEHIDENGNPCNKCETCKSIDEQTQIGIKYISMANNGSAEDVRKLMADARLSQPIKKQVFILDEVQNLSSAAQDAMLIGLESETIKTLFILCTTDPEKIKPAILSRVQQRTFSSIKTSELIKHLANIMKTENLKGKFTKEQIIQAAQDANGSARNAIRNLELLMSDGVIRNSHAFDLCKAIIDGESVEVYKISNLISEEGQNYTKTTEELYKMFSKMLQIKSNIEIEDLKLNSLSENTTGNFVLKALKELGDTLTYISNKAVEPRILMEIACTKLALISKKGK